MKLSTQLNEKWQDLIDLFRMEILYKKNIENYITQFHPNV